MRANGTHTCQCKQRSTGRPCLVPSAWPRLHPRVVRATRAEGLPLIWSIRNAACYLPMAARPRGIFLRRVQEVPGSIPGTALWAALRRLILGASLGCADVRARGPRQNTVMPIAPRGTQAPKGGVVQVRSVISAPAWACLAARAMLKRTFAPPLSREFGRAG